MDNLRNDWFVAESETEGQSLITRGRLNLEDLRKSGDYNYRVEIRWIYRPDSLAMPQPQERDLIDGVFDLVSKVMESDWLAIMTAVHTGAGVAIAVFYTKSLDEFSSRLDKSLSGYPQLPINVGAVKDTGWDDYHELMNYLNI